MNKYRKFIKKGVIESLDKVPFHGKAPIKRLSMLNKSLIPQSDTHIAVHFVDASKDLPKYSKLHKHNHDEINLILSEDSSLTYEIQLEDDWRRQQNELQYVYPIEESDLCSTWIIV